MLPLVRLFPRLAVVVVGYSLLLSSLFSTGCVAQSAKPDAPTTAATSAAPVDDFNLPASDDGLPGAGPLRRSDWFRKTWHDRRAAFATTAVQDKGSLVFLGDSITQGWGAQLSPSFPNAHVSNRAISGDTSRGVLVRLPADVLPLKPKGAVLLVGTNDLADAIAPEAIAGNVKLIIASLHEQNPTMPIVLCAVMPSSTTKQRPVAQIKLLNQLYRAIVRDQPHVTYLDTWTLFADAQGDAKLAEFPDLLHPNSTGYAKWSAALQPLLDTLGLSAPAADNFQLEAGFVSLFNGRDLSGWRYLPSSTQDMESAKRWQKGDPEAAAWPFVTETVNFDRKKGTPDGRFLAKNGRLVVTTPSEYRKIQKIWTQREFPKDFVLKLEFRATPNTDSGIYLRGPQLQCRDYLLAGPYKQLQNYKPQDWNEIVVTVKNNVAHCTCNGEVLEEAMKVPATGPIGLEGDRGQMEYRRIRICEMM